MKIVFTKIQIVFIAGLIGSLAMFSFTNDKSIQDRNRVVGENPGHAFVRLQKITKYYTKDELNKMPKLQLIDIYKARLTYLIEVLPFLSLHPEPGATFHDMSIPETEANIAHLDKEAKNKEDFIKSLSETLDDVIPYSEKNNIVWSILFFDEMIKKSSYIEKEAVK